MAKAIHYKNEEQKEFYKLFSGLCSSRSDWQVWRFVEGFVEAMSHKMMSGATAYGVLEAAS